MARKAKQESKPAQASAPLGLTSADGQPLLVFSAAVVSPLRRMVTLLASDGKLPSRLALVSALREEGVTYNAMALATLLANDLAGGVCLVELNWEWPAVARLAGQGVAPPPPEAAPAEQALGERALASQGGLAAVLAGACDIESVLVRTGLPNLVLLPAGNLPVEGREAIVRGAQLREIVEQLSERFEYLVLDVPAVAATSDAIPLARLGTGVLLVVRQGVTPRRVVAAALDDLSTCNLLGVILNRARIATPRFLLKLIPQD